MHLLDLTLDTPAANLALDEALLDACAEGELPTGGLLRIWESPQTMVVVGRASKLAQEVDLATCEQLNLPVLRRISGGMAIVAGPGCLMFAVVDRLSPQTGTNVDQLHHYAMRHLTASLQRLGLSATHAGTCDIATLGGDTLNSAALGSDSQPCKVSGNSLRLGRNAFLYHGTFLYDFDLPLIERCLRPPPRSPDYRQGRPHQTFVANLPTSREPLIDSLINTWQAYALLPTWPQQRVARLVQERYGLTSWNQSR